MRKRLIALFIVVMMMVGLVVGCGSSVNDTTTDTPEANTGNTDGSDSENTDTKDIGKTLKLGWIIHNIDQFQTELYDQAAIYAKENGIQLVMFDSKEDVSTQLSQIQTCAGSDFDGCVIIPVASDSGPELVAAAGDMPVVFANQMPTDLTLFDGKTCTYVGSNENDAGRMEGEFLAEYFEEKGMTSIKAVLFMGPLGVDAVTKRTDSAKKALADAGIDVEYVFEDTAEWDRAKSMEKMIQFMGTGTHYDCVISNNDDMALGVIEAYSSLGKELDVPIVGVDATQVGREAIKDGTLSCTVFQNPVGIGQGGVKALVSIINGEDIQGVSNDGIVWIPYELVTTENVDSLPG